MARQYRLVHDPILTRWLMTNFPFGTYQINVRLGAVKKEFLKAIPAKYSKVGELVKHIADAVVIWKGKVRIVECVVRPADWDKMFQLEIYEDAFRKTDKFKKYWNWPIEKIFLTTETDPYMESQAAKRGIKVIKYRPKGVEAYLASLRKRQQTPKGSALE